MTDKLQTLLRVRHYTLRQTMSAHADVLREADAAHHRRAAKESEIAAERDRIGLDPLVTYADYERYARQAHAVLETLASEEAAAAARVKASQERLTQAFRDVKAVEQVCVARETAARRARDRADQAKLDEAAAARRKPGVGSSA